MVEWSYKVTNRLDSMKTLTINEAIKEAKMSILSSSLLLLALGD